MTFFTLTTIGIFKIGQTYTIEVVSLSNLTTQLYQNGRQINYIITPYFVLLLTTFIHTVINLVKKPLHFNLPTTSFLLVFLFIILSSINANYLQILSLLYSLEYFIYFIVFIKIASTIKQLASTKQQQVLNAWLVQLIIIISFISLIALLQFVKRNILGLNIEAINYAPVFGKGSDESNLFFRPIGLTDHANILASQMFKFLSTVIIITLVLIKKRKLLIPQKKIIFITILTTIIIILTQSRAVYIATTILLITTFFSLKKKKKKIVKYLSIVGSSYKIPIIITLTILSIITSYRLILSFNTFSTGGWLVRQKLNKLAITIIKNHPLLGTGTDTFISEASSIDSYYGVMSYFPESVHNGFLLIISENGLLTFFSLLLAYYFLVKQVTKAKLDHYQYPIYAVFIGLIVIAIFQPSRIIIPLPTTTLILLNTIGMI